MLQNHDMFEKICLEAVAQPEACNFTKKETLAQVFSCEFCEISKNTFFYRTPLVAAFGAIICFICLLYLNKEQM